MADYYDALKRVYTRIDNVLETIDGLTCKVGDVEKELEKILNAMETDELARQALNDDVPAPGVEASAGAEADAVDEEPSPPRRWDNTVGDFVEEEPLPADGELFPANAVPPQCGWHDDLY